MTKYMKIQKKSLLQRLLKMPRNTRLKPYTTRMAKIQGPKEGKAYSNIYKEEWTQPWPMGSKIYPKVHENPKAFFINSSPILLEPLAHSSGNWSFPREDCIIRSPTWLITVNPHLEFFSFETYCC